MKRYPRVEVDMFFLDPCLLLYHHRHKLTEQFTHYLHTFLSCRHIINLVTHSEKDCFDSTSARSVIKFGISLSDIRHSDKGRRRLHIVEHFLEAVESTDTTECEPFFLGEQIISSQLLEELSCVPVKILFHITCYCIYD